MGEGSWDVAQVCQNGHAITYVLRQGEVPSQSHCEECGETTVTACGKCGAPIRGYYNVPGVIGGFDYSPPKFCHNCGAAHPWTERRIEVAKELAAEMYSIAVEDRKLLADSIDDLVRDTPRTPVAGVRFKRLMSGAGRATVEAFRDILVDIVSETARKSMGI